MSRGWLGWSTAVAYDSEPWNDPERPVCPKCSRTIAKNDKTTIMHFHDDPYGHRGASGRPWHAECARPYWDKLSGVIDQLNRLGGRF
jgi:uncharacterized protein with PIN domain